MEVDGRPHRSSLVTHANVDPYQAELPTRMIVGDPWRTTVILTPTHLALVMEYASGGKLFVFCIMHDCVPAIVHYDVTTKNALLDVDFEAHVVDFGAARFLKFDALHSADVAGTHGYMAPGDLSHQEETSTSQV
ncbi:serine/threonine-protein kinase BRI1-like 1 [Cucumis melo var. makuwa]|uniref:non-specific serine/threonine protein kinase n=1 Tax=Cucumis melo var. makuwa TaxID=1194695 RepID=A0A5D3CWV3_CUCMM|nr:serine/threonine-protein kinase BRI1-like 1 [Cucumis melo var. makuwa]